MNGKKIQANMQINVGFVADTTELVKQIEGKFKQLNLGSSLLGGVSTSLDKNFKDIQTNLEKMMTGLGKKGLNAKQYENVFSTLNDSIRRSVDNVKLLGEELTKAFNSDKNKEYLKQLEEQKKILEEIEELNTKRRRADTRAVTNATKARDEFGIDFSNKATTGMLDDIIARRASGIKKLTPTQQNSILGGLSEEGLKRVITLYNQHLEQLRTAINYNKEMQQLAGAKGSGDDIVRVIQNRIDKLNQESISQEQLNEVLSEYTRLYGQLDTMSVNLGTDFSSALGEGTTKAEELAKTGATFKEILGQFGIVFSAAKIAKVFKDLIKYSFDFYKSLDSALNQIYVVSNLTSNAVNGLTSNFINMAKQTGMSIDDVTRAAVLFYQQGLNTDEVLIMTEVTAQFAKVASIDATDAADKLTAAVNGYCLAAEDAMTVADKFNKVAAASAADINELSTAFSKAAAQANQAGVSMDNYLAYIATMEEATREAPENLGTSLKTIFSRMQQIKTGENSEEGVDVNNVETALRSVGIALRDTTGQLRDLEEIFDELGPKWNSLDRNTQAYLGTIIAGTRQQSRFITLMQNWDRVMELAAESENSAGQQALMHAKAMDSIESKLQQLKVSWQEFVSNLADSKIFKGVLDTLKGLINLLNSGNQPLTLLSLTLVALAKPIQKLGEAGGDKLKNFWNNLKDWHKNFTGSNVQNAEQALDTIGKEIDEINIKLKDTNITTKERELLVEQLDAKEKAALKAQRSLLEQKAQQQKAVAQATVAAGAAISGMGVMMGNVDQNMGGLISGLGGIVSAIGLASLNPVAAAVTAASTLLNLVITIAKWSDRLKEKMTDAVNSVKDAVQEFSNTTTQIKTTDSLIKKYDQLSKAIFRTDKEQEELNKTIQELGDLHDIDVITDEFGNLHINITDVKQALKDLNTERQKQADELRSKEINGLYDATSGLFNSNSPEAFYDELFATSSSEYKSLLSTIDDKLTADSRVISTTLAKTFASNLNSELVKEVKRNRYNYIDEGFGNAMMRMNKTFNEKLSTSDWNSLYEELNYLEGSINEMSFKDVQENIDNFYDNWSGKNKLAADEWEALRNTINNTVFKNSSLLDFYNEVGTMGSKINGEYYKQQKDAIEKQKQLYKYGKANQALQAGAAGVAAGGGLIAGAVGGGMAGAKIGGTIGAALGPIGAAVGLAIGGLAGWGISELFKSDAQKEYEGLLKVEERLEKQRKNYAKELAKEWDVSTKEAKKLLDVQLQISDVMQGLTMDTQSFLSSITELYSNTENMSSKAAQEYADILANSLNSVEGVQGDAHRTNALIAALTQDMENASPEVKVKLQKVIDEAFNNLALPANYTFTQLIDQLDAASEDLRTMNSIMEEFNENGYISIDTFKDLAKILDNVDLDNLYAVSDLENGINYVDQYIDALKNLQLAFDDENGAIGLNGEALQNLQSIQEAITRSKIVGLKNELIARKAQVEAEIAYIDAQIAGTKEAINAIKSSTTAKVKAADIEKKANAATQKSFADSVDLINDHYATDIQNFNTWSVAVLGGLAAATEAWGRYWKAVAGEGAQDLGDLYNKAQKATTNITWTPYKTLNIENRFGKTLDTEEQEILLGELDDLLIDLDNAKARYAKEIEALDVKINFLDELAGSDLSKWGAKASSSAKELEKYIGKLKEIYNILNRIQVLEHRLSMLDAYSEVARGEYYGDLLQERLSYNNELLKQYQFLTMERKKQANGYKEFIQEIEGLEGVFDFDKYGQIIINWDKYMALQDEAIDGEVTMKQKADDVYDAYTGIFKEVQDYLSKTIDYYKKVIQLGREMVDAYISLQNRTANAVKEIYKDILDTKLDAIDREKEAIEELRKERERANKEAKDAKEIAGIQSDIQRAMMDTSGASATALIKAQGRLDDKLSSVGEDKYTEMLNDITNRLDEEKEMLQQEFDDMFDDLNWLFTELDDNIMNNLDLINGILNQTQDWRQKSKLEQADEQEKRDKEFYSYFGKTLEGEEGIYNIYRKIGDIKDNVRALDDGAVTNIAEATAEIWQTLESWEKNGNPVKVSNASAFYGGGGGGGGTPSSPTPSNNPTGGDKVSSASGSYTITLDNGYNMCTYKTVKAGQSVSLPALDRAGYKFNGWSIPSLGMCSNGAFTYKPTKSETVTALWAPQTSSITNPKNSSTQPFSISTSPWMPAGVSVGGVHAKGGLVNYTGLGWLDGTPQNPEMVLDALQTKHFINFANTLDKMYSQPAASNNSITIDTISFNVESMSSPEDGQKAFSAFVDKFNEIGSQTGLKFNNFKNTL